MEPYCSLKDNTNSAPVTQGAGAHRLSRQERGRFSALQKSAQSVSDGCHRSENPGASGLDVLRESQQAGFHNSRHSTNRLRLRRRGGLSMKEGGIRLHSKNRSTRSSETLVELPRASRNYSRDNLILRESFSSRYGFPRIGRYPMFMKASASSTTRPPPTGRSTGRLGSARRFVVDADSFHDIGFADDARNP